MDYTEYTQHLRESRAFMRRMLAQRIMRDIIRNEQHAKGQIETYWSVDGLAQFAEDTAQALVRRLAAREENEIANGVWAATERV